MEPPQKRSALEHFFNDFVPRLTSYGFDDDPTLDLDLFTTEPGSQPPEQVSASNKAVSQDTFRVSQKRDLSMDELRLIVGQLKGGGPYSEKLILIMLRGLEKTLSSNYYRLFVEYGPPDNWLPIVKLNDDNAPFVEFLIKSDLSDQDPCSQLSEYSTEHMALCKYVLGQLHERATRRRQPAVTNGSHEQQSQSKSRPSRPQQTRAVCSAPKQPCNSLSVPPKPKMTTDKENQRKSLPAPMVCSTPIAQRHRPAAAVATSSAPPAAKRPQAATSSNKTSSKAGRSTGTSIGGSQSSLEDQLNDSKRVPPPRKCKSNTSGGSYSRYF